MKSNNAPNWIDLVYYVPPESKQWPSAAEWAYALAFVLVFFVAIPWLMGE